MRLLFVIFTSIFGFNALSAADLGHPIPMPAKEKQNETPGLSSFLPLRVPNVESQAHNCTCGSQCECVGGQFPACPVQVRPVEAATTYRMVWVRRTGWVWVADQPTASSGGCAGGACSLSGCSK